MAAYDLVVRDGLIYDGNGGAPFAGDVAISGGKIAAVGKVAGSGAEEISAKGKIVTPGFVDIHTHYDAQVTWADRVQPSTSHGVTTVVMGNCAVGFAPCKPDQRDQLIEVMEGVEDIPGIVMKEGIPWNWTTFPEYLDALAARRYDCDVATQVPHAAVRVFVMGKRGVDREPATAADIAAMARIVREGVEAGALGFSTSRMVFHRLKDGRLAPTITASEAEFSALAQALKSVGKGVIQLSDSFHDVEDAFAMWRRIVKQSGRPTSFGLIQSSGAADKDDWRRMLQLVDEAQAEGLPITGQVHERPVGILFGLTASVNAFVACPSYRPLDKLPLDQKVKALRDPALRAKLLAEAPDHPDERWIFRMRNFDNIFPLGNPPNYSPAAEDSIAAEAQRRGVPAVELMYDLLLARDGRELFLYPTANFRDKNLNAALEMMKHPHTVIGIADGGAHVNMLCDAGAPTYVLTHWTRDTKQYERLPLEWAVKALARTPARTVGLNDRGVIAAGYKADLNVIDYDKLRLHAPYSVNDLPLGGPRFIQTAEGYTATVVNGAVTYRDGEATQVLPGRLVRGAQGAPTAH